MGNDTNGCVGFDLTTWMGWVGEYMPDQGTTYGADPKRVDDVGLYLTTLMGENPTRHYCPHWVTDALEGYLADAPCVEDAEMVTPEGVSVGWGTVTDLIGYLWLRYENALEG